MNTSIQPVSVWPKTATSLRLVTVSVRLGNVSAPAVVYGSLRDANDDHVRGVETVLSQEQYDNWGTDDAALVAAVLSNLSLTAA